MVKLYPFFGCEPPQSSAHCSTSARCSVTESSQSDSRSRGILRVMGPPKILSLIIIYMYIYLFIYIYIYFGNFCEFQINSCSWINKHVRVCSQMVDPQQNTVLYSARGGSGASSPLYYTVPGEDPELSCPLYYTVPEEIRSFPSTVLYSTRGGSGASRPL